MEEYGVSGSSEWLAKLRGSTERTRAKRLVREASRGRCSQMVMAGVLVAMG
jgi:hypothetical protein